MRNIIIHVSWVLGYAIAAICMTTSEGRIINRYSSMIDLKEACDQPVDLIDWLATPGL